VKQKLAEALANFHLLALSMVGESIRNDGGVVFVYDVIVCVAGGEDHRAMCGDSCSDKRGGKDIFVVDQDGVDLSECHIRHSLLFGEEFGVLHTSCGVVAVVIEEVAGYFSFGLWVFCRNEFWCRGLRLVGTMWNGFPPVGLGGNSLWCGRWCWGGYVGSGSRVSCCIFDRILLCEFRLENLLDWNHCWCSFKGPRRTLVCETLLLQLGNSSTKCSDLVVQLVCGFLKGLGGISS